MNFRFRLQQVLDLKENEKNLMEAEYSEAYLLFESIAEKLYGSLKKKESLEEQHSQHMKAGATILDIRSFDSNLTALQKRIEEYQRMFQQAREDVEQKKDDLVDRSVDVKKYEKLKETEFHKFRQNNKISEMKFYDEISNARYLNQ